MLELVGPDGRSLHITAQAIGFREIEVRDKQILVNGKRIMVKGTNRAETDPDTGRYNTRQRQRDDVFGMKRLHLNAVRTSHYPSDPYLYKLADKHGLWIDDEVDIETHAHESCPSACLAAKPEWQAAFADRFQAMVARDKNHPSVLMWDTGNEAGLGTAHYAMAAWADANEPTRLLYHQSNSPDGDAPFADVDGPPLQHAGAPGRPYEQLRQADRDGRVRTRDGQRARQLRPVLGTRPAQPADAGRLHLGLGRAEPAPAAGVHAGLVEEQDPDVPGRQGHRSPRPARPGGRPLQPGRLRRRLPRPPARPHRSADPRQLGQAGRMG
nr:hypothetical protein GCM10020092_079760 [Actinoplanes digitatis]